MKKILHDGLGRRLPWYLQSDTVYEKQGKEWTTRREMLASEWGKLKDGGKTCPPKSNS